jgi:hypothetical protein
MRQLSISSSIVLLLLVPGRFLTAQGNIGINTTTPERNLEVAGSGDEYVRLHSTSNSGGEAALELVLGGPASQARDYKLTNDEGTFRIMTTTDNFATAGNELMRINFARRIGIGTNDPVSKLHIDNGEEASNTGDGYLMIGTNAGSNLVFDPNEITSRNNDNANSIQLQSHDGNTIIGEGSGNTYIGNGGGNLGIGTTSTVSKLSIDNDDFQLYLRNSANGLRDWYIGASNLSWLTSDNQLLFSPGQASDGSVLRLMDIAENGGTIAPVMIKSSDTQTLLLDGNEIDGKDDAIYINHNSNQETYINPSGGRVAIANDEPGATLQITKTGSEHALRLQRDNYFWDIDPSASFNYLGFIKDGWTLGRVDGASGQWMVFSDRRMKNNIEELSDVLTKLKNIDTYTYTFKHSTTPDSQIGIIAQDIALLFPEMVSYDQGTYHVAYSKLSVILLKALKEQQKEIDALQNEITTLMEQVNE